MNNINTLLNEIIENNELFTVAGLGGSAIPLVLGQLLRHQKRPLVIVSATEERAEALATELATFSGEDILYYPGESHLPYSEVAYDFEASLERLALQTDLLTGKPWTAITLSLQAFVSKTMAPDELSGRARLLLPEEDVDRQELIDTLITCGYEKVSTLEECGTFAVRGAIVDFFRPNDQNPVRIDFFGDTIEHIDSFSLETQRRLAALESIEIYPIREICLDEKSKPRLLAALEQLAADFDLSKSKLEAMRADIADGISFFGIESFKPLLYARMGTFWDYVKKYHPILILEEGEALNDQAAMLATLAREEYQAAKERQSPHLPPESHLALDGEYTQLIDSIFPRVDFCQFAKKSSFTPIYEPLTPLKQELSARRINPSLGEVLDPLIESLARWKNHGYRVLLACATENRAKRLQELLRGRKINLEISRQPITKALEQIPRIGGLLICQSLVLEAFRCDDYIIVPDNIIYGLPPAATGRTRLQKARVQKQPDTNALRHLKEGDLVIHSEHGVARYLGIKRLTIEGMVGDYLWLEYADNVYLYLPMVHLGLVHPYRGPEGAKLDSLTSGRWEKARQKVRQATQELAARLLALNAQRQLKDGHAFTGNEDSYAAFEARFPYDETPDQQKAIEAVLADLQAPHPMDRLICGDVGFGKTEVAIRAAYRVVLDGYQVAVLVPTTILAMQHGRTFSERLRDEPVRIEVLSRFRSTKEIKRVLADTAAGKVDILIGTHRLLSGDVTFAKLGLLVVDEEQRFGVRHKEKLKELKAEVDTLTLTATPIPRTMYMSMVGLRDISLIRTPPVERHAVKTMVCRYEPALLSEAIGNELARGGQVYLLYNDVGTIEKMAAEVRLLVPNARVAIAHGQMNGNGLENVMADFISQVSNVLVCSTIIENGLDIPSVNTIVVIRADLFGLSQLYQIRGRVGRGRQKAYAYLFLPEAGSISQEAKQRLSALQRYSGLGDGVSIAQEDLEIRGSGDLLGPDQSGNIAAVGFELYTELLAEAVEKLKGRDTGAMLPTIEIKLPITAHIPDNYIPDIGQRITYYQQLSQAEDNEKLQNLAASLTDMFGPLPEPLENLLALFALQPMLRDLGATALQAQTKEGHTFFSIQLTGNGLLAAEKLFSLCQRFPDNYRITPTGRLVIHHLGEAESDADWVTLTRDLISKLWNRAKGI